MKASIETLQDMSNARVQYSLQQNEYPQMSHEASQAERTSRSKRALCKRSCTLLLPRAGPSQLCELMSLCEILQMMHWLQRQFQADTK